MKMKDVVAEGTLDDLGLRGHGRELDQDDEGGPGFKQAAMFDQLGKILDSRSNPKPLTYVTTDDGEKVEVNFEQAHELRKLLRAEGMKPQLKMRFTKELQMSNHLHDFVDSGDYHKIGAVFMQKYM